MLALSLIKVDVKGFELGGQGGPQKREAQKIPRGPRVAQERPPPKDQGGWAMGEKGQGQGYPWSD